MAPVRLICAEGDALATQLAELVIPLQNEQIKAGKRFNVFVSGGSVVDVFAKAFVNRAGIDWKAWTVFFIDERIVHKGDADSNAALFAERVYDKLNLKSKDEYPRVVALNDIFSDKEIDTLPISEIAAGYEKAVYESGNEFQLALLGMGPDGHTCSLFPNHALLKEDSTMFAALDDSPKPPPKRITATMPFLESIGKLVFIACGASKQTAMHKIFKENDTSLPTKQVINAVTNEVMFFTDPAALGQTQ